MSRFIIYTSRHYDKLIRALLQHLEMVGITLLISVALALVISLLIMERKKLTEWIIRAWSMVYAIPSLALFALLIPVTGLGMKTAILVLVIYNQYILVRSFTQGLCGMEPAVLEAAEGMGMTKWQIFMKVRLPLALDAMAAGIHIAIISTIGIATIGATIGAGGLGSILFDGMRTQNAVKIVWGTVLSVALVLGANAVLKLAERKIKQKIYHLTDNV